MRDAHYTGADIARLLATSISDLNPANVADFTCGNGSLLEAAATLWPSSELTGVDVESSVESSLRLRVPNVSFLAADFLSSEMPDAELLGQFDAILLNPPFSCPGGRTERVSLAGSDINCSRAMAFVIRALQYLAKDGAMAALLPKSCLFSDKDSAARQALSRLFQLESVILSNPPQFRGCSVNTVIIIFRRREIPDLARAQVSAPATDPGFDIKRGGRPNLTAYGESDLAPFVHTTELASNSIKFSRRVSAHSRDKVIQGPAILMPRVGRPSAEKLCFLSSDQTVRISDCIVAITHPQSEVLIATYNAMLTNWQSLEEQYQGTCAQYVTISRLRSYLSLLIDSGEIAAAA